MLKLIKKDLFGIVNRIKSLNSNYYVFYNSNKKCYELYYKNGFNYNLELTFSSSCLTVLDYIKVCNSRICNAKKIIKQIEEDNQKLQDKNNELLKDELISKTKTLLRVGG